MILANKLGALGALVFDEMEDALDELSPSAAALLLGLYYRAATTATELAAVAGVTQPTAVRVLDGLVRRGLIERRSRIGRIAPLRLTRAGQKRSQSLQTARLRAMGRLLIVLTERERSAFHRTLDRVLAAATTARRCARTTCRLCDHVRCDGPLCPIGTRAIELERRVGS